jgi:hypothetical protein
MRSFAITFLMLVGLLCGTNHAARAQSSCKVCSEQQAARMKNYAGPTCKSEYQICMKSCGKKS